MPLALALACGACSPEAGSAAPAPYAASNTGGQDAGAGFGNAGGSGGSVLLRDAGPSYVSFTARPCPTGSTLTYENFGAHFFAQHCEPCHASSVTGAARNSAPVGISFDDLPAIVEQRQTIWNVAGDQNMLMPPINKPTPDERARLGEWLACGARSANPGAATDAGTP